MAAPRWLSFRSPGSPASGLCSLGWSAAEGSAFSEFRLYCRRANSDNSLIPEALHFKPSEIKIIETHGFTAAFEAIETALKTANVEVLARETLGGGYIAILIKGDVAAVRAAIDAGKARVEGLGKLIAAHVIPSPSKGVLALLPK